MYVCDDNHDEIVHDGYDCPLCDALKENEELEDKVTTLEKDVADYQNQIKELEVDIETFENIKTQVVEV